METSNPRNLQLEAKRRLQAKVITIRTMLEAALANLSDEAHAETCFLDAHIDDIGDHPNRIANAIDEAKAKTLSSLGRASTAINEWAPATPGRRETVMGE
jgi:hypothetical protein